MELPAVELVRTREAIYIHSFLYRECFVLHEFPFASSLQAYALCKLLAFEADCLCYRWANPCFVCSPGCEFGFGGATYITLRQNGRFALVK